MRSPSRSRPLRGPSTSLRGARPGTLQPTREIQQRCFVFLAPVQHKRGQLTPARNRVQRTRPAAENPNEVRPGPCTLSRSVPHVRSPSHALVGTAGAPTLCLPSRVPVILRTARRCYQPQTSQIRLKSSRGAWPEPLLNEQSCCRRNGDEVGLTGDIYSRIVTGGGRVADTS